MATKGAFLERIARVPLVFDGAMGTMIYERGVFINACYDELCLARPELILTIHQEYVEAGADVIESNTFGANRMSRCKTKQDGIEAGIEIAREIRQALTGRVAGFQVSAPFGRIDVALKVLAD
jgi:homocysteine S-methyltransferase